MLVRTLPRAIRPKIDWNYPATRPLGACAQASYKDNLSRRTLIRVRLCAEKGELGRERGRERSRESGLPRARPRVRMRPRSSSRDHRERNLGGIRERNPGKVLVEFERNAGGIREEFQVTSAAFAADFGGLRG